MPPTKKAPESNNMDLRALETLEFSVVKEIVAQFATSDLGRESIQEQKVSTSPEIIRREYDLVGEMIDAIAWRETMPMDGLCDIRPSLHAVRPAGTYLDPADLLQVDKLLKAAARLRAFFQSARDDFPRLHRVIERCLPIPEFEGAVQAALTPDGEVSDNATPALAEIRRETRAIAQRIEKVFDRMLRSPQTKQLLQEAYVTERKGRKVLPVRSDFRGHISGIVHDVSISGGTVFVEPMAVVGLSNEQTQLEAREEEEIRRILLSLSDCLRRNLDAVLSTVEVLSKMDMLYGKARFAERYACGIPGISGDRVLRLEKGRHPLLLKSHEKTCVPLNVSLGPSDRVLVISGPNAGGKTTAAKTIAVLCLLAQTSTPIPADANSVLPIFSGVFADIGDSQDISLGVSTFTSHLGQVNRVLQKAGGGSLVVLDELGTATDPAEGAVLAEAILEELTRKGALTLVTSHFPTLKQLHLTREWARSASMGLDPRTEKPNFTLSMDVPGESSGLTIARQIGIPSEVIERAYSLMSEQQRDLSHALDAVTKEKGRLQNLTRELEDARRELEEEKAHHAQLSQSLETDRANLRLEQLKFRQTVLAEKQKIVLDARKRVEQMIARLPSRKEIALARKQLKEENRRTQEESTQVQKDIDRLTGVPGRDLALDELHVGLDVWARNLRQAGTIRAVYPGKRKVDIAVQGLVFNVDIDDLAECPPKESEAPVPSGKTTVPHKELLSTELNLIGQRVEEAIGLLDRFLNDVSFSNVDQIRIIHGRGTGALRRGVREFLRSHPLVEGFHAEDEEEGEKGAVTVVRLK